MKTAYIQLKAQSDFSNQLFSQIQNVGQNVYGTLVRPDQYHLTLIAETPSNLTKQAVAAFLDPDAYHTGVVTDIVLLGPQRAACLLIDSPSIAARHSELKNHMRHNFQDFSPHLSIAYGVSNIDILTFRPALLNVIGSEIVFHTEKFVLL